jgi:hypothetical protein
MTWLTVMEYLCHKWPRVCFTCRKHFSVKLAKWWLQLYQKWASCCSIFSFCVMFCRSLFVFLSLVFLPLYCLLLWFTTSNYPRVSLVEQELTYPSGAPGFTPVFNGVRVTRSLVLYVCFVDRCLSFCTFYFGHCVVCSSSMWRSVLLVEETEKTHRPAACHWQILSHNVEWTHANFTLIYI